MSDEIFPGSKTGPDEFEQRADLEQQDIGSLQREQFEQQRIAGGMIDPFAANRVPAPGSGDDAGGRVRINRNHWGE